MSLCSQIRDASKTRKSKKDVTDYYKQKYPGVKTDSRGRRIEAWRSHATTAYVGATGLSRKSAAREFQGARGESSGKANKAIWEGIGESLPPMPPSGGYHIYGTIWVKYSEECEERDIDEYITGKQARMLAEMECEDVDQAVINQYQNEDITERGGSPGECNPPELIVEGAEDEEGEYEEEEEEE